MNDGIEIQNKLTGINQERKELENLYEIQMENQFRLLEFSYHKFEDAKNEVYFLIYE